MIEIKINDRSVLESLNRLQQMGSDMSPVMRKIAGILHDQTEQNFADESGPTGKWDAVKDKRRVGGQILQDTGRLANSITASSDADSASIGTNVVYAAIHQLGGTINKPAQSRLVRHRTDRKGNILGNFAKDSHKNAVSRWFGQDAHDINMSARPFFPITSGGRLQSGVEEKIGRVVADHIRRVIGG